MASSSEIASGYPENKSRHRKSQHLVPEGGLLRRRIEALRLRAAEQRLQAGAVQSRVLVYV